jgi:hypothetical protein
MNKENISDLLTKPVIAGACGYLATRYITYGVNSSGTPFNLSIASTIPGLNRLNGTTLSLGMATGMFVMAGSLLGGVVSSVVYPYIHKKDHFKNIGSGMLLVSTVSGSTLLAHYAANPNAVSDRGAINIIAMAAACESVAAIAYDNVLRPMILGQPNGVEYDYYDDDFSLQFARDLF